MSRSAAAYQKFTEDEIRKANSVDILSLARGYGYEPEKAGRKAVHMKHSGGLYIFPENNRFFQWTGPDDGVKGGAIDFVMREENLSFPEAVGKLIGKEFSPSVKQVVPYEKKEREPLVLPEKADNMKRAYWYLVSVRGISPKLYESEDDLSGKEVWQLRVCRLRCGRNRPVLLHAGDQR